jgi:hypothetical protein
MPKPRDANTISFIKAFGARAAFLHNADNLVSGYYGQPGGMDVSLGYMEIGMAYAADIDSHKDFICLGNGDRQVCAFKRIALGRLCLSDEEGLHLTIILKLSRLVTVFSPTDVPQKTQV